MHGMIGSGARVSGTTALAAQTSAPVGAATLVPRDTIKIADDPRTKAYVDG